MLGGLWKEAPIIKGFELVEVGTGIEAGAFTLEGATPGDAGILTEVSDTIGSGAEEDDWFAVDMSCDSTSFTDGAFATNGDAGEDAEFPAMRLLMNALFAAASLLFLSSFQDAGAVEDGYLTLVFVGSAPNSPKFKSIPADPNPCGTLTVVAGMFNFELFSTDGRTTGAFASNAGCDGIGGDLT